MEVISIRGVDRVLGFHLFTMMLLVLAVTAVKIQIPFLFGICTGRLCFSDQGKLDLLSL